MTPEEAAAIIGVATEQIAAELEAAFAEYRRLVLDGTPPREAVEQVMRTFQGRYAETMAAAFSQILGTSVGAAAVLAMQVGAVTLSARLYADAQELGAIVQGIVQRHSSGLQDARALALELFEGYGFRPVEVLRFAASNDLLPRYLREALLPELAGDLAAAFARLQVADLTTPALRAAYADVLRAIDAIEAGAAADLLDRKLRVAFFEKARFLATRIAQTELHRAFAERQARELMDDADVLWVQWRMSITHPREDICDYFAGVDRWGAGPGVYPKALAPVPTAHPFCRCVLAPRLDIRRKAQNERPGADQAFFRTREIGEAARIAGSAAKLEQILGGADPIAILNEGVPDAYRIRTVGEAGKP